MREEIEITVNGLQERVPAASRISDLILLFEESDTHLVVELNGRFVYPEDYSAIELTPGDRIEFIHPLFGG